MTYRDDRDADQARIAALETELRQARERIDELEGRSLVLFQRGSELALTTTPRDRSDWFANSTSHSAATTSRR